MELARLGTYNSITEANLVKARLESEGIEAIVQSDDLGAMTPMMGDLRGVRVLVREADRANAMEVLERMLPDGDQRPTNPSDP
jgi:type III secretory pathway lipoprotein EscJ